LRRIALPLALPSIMAGLNQSVMMALSMVVVASMIGARGLGEDVLAGIQTLNVGQGVEAGAGDRRPGHGDRPDQPGVWARWALMQYRALCSLPSPRSPACPESPAHPGDHRPPRHLRPRRRPAQPHPSAVSLHIKTLEDELQVTLFDRSRRQVVLTEAGQLAVARAESILGAYDELADTLASGPSLRGRLRIGAIHTVLARRLPQALVWIKAHHPQLHISVVSGMSAELARRVEDGELDAAITTEPVSPYPQSLQFTPLFEDRFWAIASPELAGVERAAAARQPAVPALRQARLGRPADRQELRRQRLQVSEQMELDSQEALARMAAMGLGWRSSPWR
jgi:DNA-binding transcriptional LysR family regulator